MNINNLLNFNKPSNEKYASSFKRSSAAMIDVWIVLFLRIMVMQVLGKLWLEPIILRFREEFSSHFGTETVKNTPEHINFITHHSLFLNGIAFYFVVVLVGALYHSYFNSSSWKATIGKRLMKITIVDDNDEKISFQKALSHYFLSILPFVFMIYLVIYQIQHNMTFYQVLTATSSNVFFGIVFIIWVQIHFFTKKKTTAYDLICNTTLINEKTPAKWPWYKI